MIEPTVAQDYTRVSEDAAVLCRRQDFPRAVNVLQRRAPDHRRWRHAFRRVSQTACRALDGRRRDWMAGAVRELVLEVREPWLRAELVVDLHAAAPALAVREVLPAWTPRGLWRVAEAEGLPMQYVAQVTELPRSIDAPADTAQLVLDFRRTALAHRDQAAALAADLSLGVPADPPTAQEWLLQAQIAAQREAERRWRALALRVLLGNALVA